MADGHTNPSSLSLAELLNDNLREVPAYAEFRDTFGPKTFIFEDAARTRFVAWVDGRLDDGVLYPIQHHGRAYRLSFGGRGA